MKSTHCCLRASSFKSRGLQGIDCLKVYIVSEGQRSHPIAIVIPDESIFHDHEKTVVFYGATRLVIIFCSLKDVTANPIAVGSLVAGSPEELT